MARRIRPGYVPAEAMIDDPRATEAPALTRRQLPQRALGIGYGRAARLIDFMAEDGIVGEYKSGSAREVLYSWEEWEALKDGEGPSSSSAA